eukprot:677911-Pyramimonas_sp.AAC.1
MASRSDVIPVCSPGRCDSYAYLPAWRDENKYLTMRLSQVGGEIEVKRIPPTRKSASVSCSCRACGRGEAACAGERNDSAVG